MDAVVLEVPGPGRWLVQNSPANRVPSHGTELFGTRYAIDLVGVDERGRSGRDRRPLLAVERPERFVGFGRPVLAPVVGTVRVVHDGEEDHVARRAPLALLGFLAGQGDRVRAGESAIAGNHVVVETPGGAWVLVVHLKRGFVVVGPGERVELGQRVGECGNSGNSTEPHVHLQASDSAELATAGGLPIVFRRFREHRTVGTVDREYALPRNGAVISAA